MMMMMMNNKGTKKKSEIEKISPIAKPTLKKPGDSITLISGSDKSATIRMTISLPLRHVEKLRRLSEMEHRPFSHQIFHMMEHYIKTKNIKIEEEEYK